MGRIWDSWGRLDGDQGAILYGLFEVQAAIVGFMPQNAAPRPQLGTEIGQSSAEPVHEHQKTEPAN